MNPLFGWMACHLPLVLQVLHLSISLVDINSAWKVHSSRTEKRRDAIRPAGRFANVNVHFHLLKRIQKNLRTCALVYFVNHSEPFHKDLKNSTGETTLLHAATSPVDESDCELTAWLMLLFHPHKFGNTLLSHLEVLGAQHDVKASSHDIFGADMTFPSSKPYALVEWLGVWVEAVEFDRALLVPPQRWKRCIKRQASDLICKKRILGNFQRRSSEPFGEAKVRICGLNSKMYPNVPLTVAVAHKRLYKMMGTLL
ncbi:hypothetical protein IW261DRAFT_1416706 [Armillaria novae-zelandiae]|uniref:Secreted protein n=1 Tax=Armillaria novae-zelandiae TaxID=153914 RepID=A0AA39UJ29_9AGAR|nr:hypothetical protein IW261DRAFT_1416706 [Armillaria novae-zelandiae]